MSDSAWQTAKATELVEPEMTSYLKDGEAAEKYKGYRVLKKS